MPLRQSLYSNFFGAYVEFTPDWNRIIHHWDGRRFRTKLRKHVGKATNDAARLIEREIKKRIRSGQFVKNAPLTQLLKRGRRPLIEKGELVRRKIVHRRLAWDRAWVGVPRSVAKFGLIVADHGGPNGTQPTLIPVTKRMRFMFTMLSWKSHGWDVNLTGRALELWNKNPNIKWRALSKSTTHIVIPPRPFIRDVWLDQRVMQNVVRFWTDAVIQALKPVP